ncbi:MAG: ABC transporter substrate-binding protein [Candidatus Protistobacter heckmanni]|nr:ABC transporter substrate-binding protein [Candidatus Protistobacter heckmanni]
MFPRVLRLHLRAFLSALVCLCVLGLIDWHGRVLAQNQSFIKIGEINSYALKPQYSQHYRNGWLLAVEEANAKGGLLSRKIEVISREDEGLPEEALRQAAALVRADKVDLLSGGFQPGVARALADFAKRNKVIYVASSGPAWDRDNRYAFRPPVRYVKDPAIHGFAQAY